MTRQQAMEITREMREAGHTWRAIADHLNEAGSRVKGDSLWSASGLFNAFYRDSKPAHVAKPRKPARESISVLGHISIPPQEILAGNPKDPVAILDLANRARYFAGESLDPDEIRAINRMYHKGESA